MYLGKTGSNFKSHLFPKKNLKEITKQIKEWIGLLRSWEIIAVAVCKTGYLPAEVYARFYPKSNVNLKKKSI